ncbi:MAG: hypothetical protein HY881_03995 [Deltaproteobacteria bacterium]|nr:hypothetical protein [Deltaproteobacteria bacterium]
MRKLSGIMFDRRDHVLLTIVNDVLNRDKRQEYNKRKFYPHFHPHGIKKLAESRGLRIAYAVIHLLESLEAGKQDERLGALRALRDEVLNASDGDMPKNTASALLQIMKELVRSQGDYNRQLLLAHDFRVTATGKPRIVRKQLQRYHLLEMPEEWNQLAFDDHVHDVNTKGRKSATHLIMDAWIKGIRRLRVVYYNYIQAPFAAELLEAAEIMGITMRIGIEYAARFRGRYVQLIWVPRGFIDTQAFLCFLTEAPVRALMEEGRQISEYRQQQVLQVLDAFNRRHLPVINETYGILLKPIDPSAFLTFVKPGQTSLLHLAKFIHTQLLPDLEKKVAELRDQCDSASPQEQILNDTLVAEMNCLDFETILERFLSPARNPELPDPQTVQDGPDVPPLLRLSPRELLHRLVQLRTAYRITLNLTDLRPEDVLELIYDCEGLITRLETFNLKDYTGGKTTLVPEISRLQVAINEGNVITLKRIILNIMDQTAASSSPDKADRLEKLAAILHDINSLRLMYKGTPLKSRIGSDSTGTSPRMHGMGLAVMETLPGRATREIFHPDAERMVIPFRMTAYRRVTCIPRKGISPLLNRFFGWAGSIPGLGWLAYEHQNDWLALEHTTRMESPGNIVTLGGIHEDAGNELYLCPPQVKEETLRLSWSYLNTLAKIIIKMTIGFIPAFLCFFLSYDWWVLKFGGAFIWFGITGVRNILQSTLGGGGLRSSPLLGWRDYVSWERIGDSLLFTGFSVPLLDWVVKTLILDKSLGITTATSPSALYAIMAASNGLYLSCHNAFRGFPKTVVAGNLFRSMLSIPIAIVFNGIIAGLLSAAGVSGIDAVLQKWAAVISKAASDFVAGVIEGGADRYRNIHLRLRDYREKLIRLLEAYTSLELLFPDKKVMETLSAMDKSLSGDAKDLELIMIIHALDLLFFWNYQPRGRTALIMLAKTLSEEERQILLGSLHILKRQREISMLFIDGIIGKNFSGGLAFYLNASGQFLEDVQKILGNPVKQKVLSGQWGLK